MPVVWIPSLLRKIAAGRESVTVAGETVGQVIDELDKICPGIKARLCDSQGLRPGMAVAVDAQITRLGLLQPVGEKSEVHFLPAVSGGACPWELLAQIVELAPLAFRPAR